MFYVFENVSPVFGCLHKAKALNLYNVSNTAYIYTFLSPGNKILGSSKFVITPFWYCLGALLDLVI